MEQVDVLNKDGNPTGEIKSRADVHRDGNWHRTVRIWILNSKHELLSQKRSPTKDVSPNCWTASASGHVATGETSIAAALKEIKEELGLELQENEVRYLFTAPRSLKIKTDMINDVADVYLVNKDFETKNLVLQEEEVSEVRWFYYAELEKMIHSTPEQFSPHHDEYVRLFKMLHELYPG